MLKSPFLITASLSLLQICMALMFLPSTTYGQSAIVLDGSFEDSTSSFDWIYWTPFTNTTGPVCGTYCDALGSTAHTGDYSFIVLGTAGPPSNYDESGAWQQIFIPASSFAELTVYINQVHCAHPDDSLVISIDEVPILVFEGTNPHCGDSAWSLYSADVSAFADGNYHMLEIYAIVNWPGWGVPMTVYYLDDISIRITPDSTTNIIKGTLFADFNGNSNQDPGEPGIAGKQVVENVSGAISFSSGNGAYYLAIPDTGSFNVTAPLISHYNTVPGLIPVNIPTFGNIDSNNNFTYQPVGAINDLKVAMTPISPFRPGMQAWYSLNYANIGTTPLIPQVIFYPDADISFVSSTPAPSLVSNDSVVWNTGSLQPFESGSISLMVVVDSSATIGTNISSSVKTEPVAGDINPVNNYHSWEVITTGSYDPNDILVSRAQISISEFPNPPFLDYVIRFQNTGNDTAFTVRINNHIPPTLDRGTFELVNASHPMEIAANTYTQLMQFTFNNILLPDSNVNEPASHGFIHYRMKPIDLLGVGDSILNRADIYFDFNQPVLTNVAVTEIVMQVGTDELAVGGGKGSLKVYPNPVRDEITVVLEGMKGKAVTLGIYDVYGILVRNIFDGWLPIDNFEVNTSLAELPGGIYFLQMWDGSGVKCRKILKL